MRVYQQEIVLTTFVSARNLESAQAKLEPALVAYLKRTSFYEPNDETNKVIRTEKADPRADASTTTIKATTRLVGKERT